MYACIIHIGVEEIGEFDWKWGEYSTPDITTINKLVNNPPLQSREMRRSIERETETQDWGLYE